MESSAESRMESGRLYLDSIVAIGSALSCLPTANDQELWIKRAARYFGAVPLCLVNGRWERAECFSDKAVHTICHIHERLMLVRTWAARYGRPPKSAYIMPRNRWARIDHLYWLLQHPGRCDREIGDVLGLHRRIIRNGRNIIQQWFGAEFLRLYVHSHHVTWWTLTDLGGLAWPQLEACIELAERLPKAEPPGVH